MSYKLFLDDVRNPEDCVTYMHARIGARNPIYLDKDWIVIRNYAEFLGYICAFGIPDLISYDHDLADEHYSDSSDGEMTLDDYYREQDREQTGYDCAKWLKAYCEARGKKHPEYFVHSMNPAGTENIKNLLK